MPEEHPEAAWNLMLQLASFFRSIERWIVNILYPTGDVGNTRLVHWRPIPFHGSEPAARGQRGLDSAVSHEEFIRPFIRICINLAQH